MAPSLELNKEGVWYGYRGFRDGFSGDDTFGYRNLSVGIEGSRELKVRLSEAARALKTTPENIRQKVNAEEKVVW